MEAIEAMKVKFDEDGFVILKNFISSQTIHEVIGELEKLAGTIPKMK